MQVFTVNLLIISYRPMMLEAAAGKNPITHVGKIYNVVAREIAETLVAKEPDITAAQCLLIGQIGAPITQPALLHSSLQPEMRSPSLTSSDV